MNRLRAGFNNITYIAQKVPTLYTVMSAGQDADNPAVYGANSNTHIVQPGQIVDIVINNFDDGSHPMHIHGHQPQLVARVPKVFGACDSDGCPAGIGFNASTAALPVYPIRRDTWMLPALGYTVIRFKADNPGVWLLHCHMEWHIEAGLTATIIEAPMLVQSQQTIPSAAYQLCKDRNISTAGNAAGNSANYTDVTGAITVALKSHG